MISGPVITVAYYNELRQAGYTVHAMTSLVEDWLAAHTELPDLLARSIHMGLVGNLQALRSEHS